MVRETGFVCRAACHWISETLTDLTRNLSGLMNIGYFVINTQMLQNFQFVRSLAYIVSVDLLNSSFEITCLSIRLNN